MTIEAESMPNEAAAPSSSQLDKIVESLGLLISMQVERDQKEKQALASIEVQLKLLREAVDQLQTNPQGFSEFMTSTDEADDNTPVNILAEYGLLDDTETNQDNSDGTIAKVVGHQKTADEPHVTTQPIAGSESSDPGLPICEKDIDEIESLKEELRQKLRDAEIERSIQRANIIQRQAKIEEREAQLRRALRLKQDNDCNDNLDADIPKGILARLKKHLRQAGLANKNELLSSDLDLESTFGNEESAQEKEIQQMD